MKFRQAAVFAVCILSIFLIITVLHVRKTSINAAASANAGRLGFSIIETQYAQPVCGNGICEAGETCATDCVLSEGTAAPSGTTTGKNVFNIKFTTFLLILLIMILCILAYLYLKEDKRTANGYWQYGT